MLKNIMLFVVLFFIFPPLAMVYLLGWVLAKMIKLIPDPDPEECGPSIVLEFFDDVVRIRRDI